jgi:hypothetical protein
MKFCIDIRNADFGICWVLTRYAIADLHNLSSVLTVDEGEMYHRNARLDTMTLSSSRADSGCWRYERALEKPSA